VDQPDPHKNQLSDGAKKVLEILLIGIVGAIGLSIIGFILIGLLAWANYVLG